MDISDFCMKSREHFAPFRELYHKLKGSQFNAIPANSYFTRIIMFFPFYNISSYFVSTNARPPTFPTLHHFSPRTSSSWTLYTSAPSILLVAAVEMKSKLAPGKPGVTYAALHLFDFFVVFFIPAPDQLSPFQKISHQTYPKNFPMTPFPLVSKAQSNE